MIQRNGSNGIEKDGIIKAGDQASVFAEKAKGKPLSRTDVEDKHGLKQGHGRDYVETDVPKDRVQEIYNPQTRSKELVIRGDVPLSNANIVRRR